MRSSVLLSCVCLLMVCGCNGKQVDPQIYRASGCPSYSMTDDFVYTGSPTWNERAYCSGPVCQPFHASADVKSFVDTYVVAPTDKIPVEVCVFIRKKIAKSRARWQAMDGNKVSIDGKEYSENFGFYDLKEHGLNNLVAKYLSEQGYTATGRGYLVYLVTRNVNTRMQMTIMYAYNFEYLPVEATKSEEALRDFLRKQFSERITVS
ncbi:hypothetical protein [uncultured Pseudodesulfovibrio sp.]|uniref:hypothetical protein n=1 Tax=uncultured Pseudodesulfovibrio sp. TaxID=2035858 RepID=UPI0029C8C284|nr:hypothetical protein [uncultured Pseudodesulfovibrio sp.]